MAADVTNKAVETIMQQNSFSCDWMNVQTFQLQSN